MASVDVDKQLAKSNVSHRKRRVLGELSEFCCLVTGEDAFDAANFDAVKSATENHPR